MGAAHHFTLIFLFAIGLIVLFNIHLRLLGSNGVLRDVLGVASRTLACLRNSAISDLEKQSAARQASRRLMRLTAQVFTHLVLAATVPCLLCLLLVYFGVFTWKAVFEAFAAWPVIVAGTAAALVVLAE